MSGEFVDDSNWAELSQNPTQIKSPELDWQGDFIALLHRTWVKSRWWIDHIYPTITYPNNCDLCWHWHESN